MRKLSLAILVATVLLARVSSAADDPKKMFEAATAEFNLGHYEKAATMYEEIYKLSLQPVLLYNIAQAHRLGGDFEKAVFFYKGFLRAQPHAQNRGEVQRRITELEEALDAKRRGQERPPNAPVVVEPRLPGDTTATPAPTTSSPATPAPSEPAPPPVAPPPAVVATTPPAPIPATPEAERRGRTKKLAGIGVASFGVAALVTGIVLAVAGSHDADLLNHPSSPVVFNPTLERNAHALMPAGVALSIVGAVGIAAGVGLYVWGHHESRRWNLALAPSLDHNGGGLAAQGSF